MNLSSIEGTALVRTIGHSTRPLDEFIQLLQSSGITLVGDIRTIPRSRTNPQYNKETLPGELGRAGLKYQHLPGLGGLRHSVKDSPNTGWRNTSFRGFADYMQKPEFVANLEELIKLAQAEAVVIMCAEAVPWRCHRSLIADALTVRGVRVEHIISLASRHPHRITPWAKIEGLKITYPPETPEASSG